MGSQFVSGVGIPSEYKKARRKSTTESRGEGCALLSIRHKKRKSRERPRLAGDDAPLALVYFMLVVGGGIVQLRRLGVA